MTGFDDFKNKQESVKSNVSWYWKFIQYSKYWDKTEMLKQNPSDKINIANN